MLKPSLRQPASPTALHDVAEDNLRFIRSAMERATTFTGVSGKGYVLAGSSALVAAWLAAVQPTEDRWLLVWMLELALGFAITLTLTARKARQQGSALDSANGRRVLLTFLPTMAAGGVLTFAWHAQGHTLLLPALWLSLYGAAVVAAGLHTIKLVPVMGLCFMLLGALLALGLLPVHATLAAGFGGLHILFGAIIWRQHGG